MIKTEGFRAWLQNKGYQGRVVGNIASRANRADKMLEYDGLDAYLFYLEQKDEFKALSMSCRSQLRRAIRLYQEYQNS